MCRCVWVDVTGFDGESGQSCSRVVETKNWHYTRHGKFEEDGEQTSGNTFGRASNGTEAVITRD